MEKCLSAVRCHSLALTIDWNGKKILIMEKFPKKEIILSQTD